MKRPHVIINCAMSADGKISTFERRQVRISGKSDLERVDALRAKSDAIMVGVGTVIADDPGLRVKSEHLRRGRLSLGKPENPQRVVADSFARTPAGSKILGKKAGDSCIIGVSHSAPKDRLDDLTCRCEIIKCGQERLDLRELLFALSERGVKILMVEGGGTLNWSLIRDGLVDEIYVYMGAIVIGGKEAPTLVDGDGFASGFPRLVLESIERLDEGALLRWRPC